MFLCQAVFEWVQERRVLPVRRPKKKVTVKKKSEAKTRQVICQDIKQKNSANCWIEETPLQEVSVITAKERLRRSLP